MRLCGTWEDVDVDDGEGVRVYVDDDVQAEQGHVELHPELSDQGGHGLGAGRRQTGHLLIQLWGEKERERGLLIQSSPLPSPVCPNRLGNTGGTFSLNLNPAACIFEFIIRCDATRDAHCGEVRARLRLGHLMAVEEDCFSVWRQREQQKKQRGDCTMQEESRREKRKELQEEGGED